MINFDELKMIEIPIFYGGAGIKKERMFFDKHGKIIRAVLEKGSCIGEHIHKTSSELMFPKTPLLIRKPI